MTLLARIARQTRLWLYLFYDKRSSSLRRGRKESRFVTVLVRHVGVLGFVGVFLSFSLLTLAPRVLGADSAVILMYHRFGEGEFPATNITLPQFEAHLRELKSGSYHVLPLPEIMAAIRSGKALPERTIGITIDDAYLSVYEEAWPRLREAGLPFTLFVATRPLDENFEDFMTWEHLRKLAGPGVSFGSHTESHAYLLSLSHAQAAQEIVRGAERLREETGVPANLFAYPYGETDLAIRQLVEDRGFIAGFGQHSGVIWQGADQMFLPRFALNERYGGMERFRLLSNALPLKARDLTPKDPVISQNPPFVGFTADAENGPLSALACFPSHMEEEAEKTLIGRRVEIRFSEPFPEGRARINCTLKGPGTRWRWLGIPFFIR